MTDFLFRVKSILKQGLSAINDDFKGQNFNQLRCDPCPGFKNTISIFFLALKKRTFRVLLILRMEPSPTVKAISDRNKNLNPYFISHVGWNGSSSRSFPFNLCIIKRILNFCVALHNLFLPFGLCSADGRNT
jgi:hypothetical protein